MKELRWAAQELRYTNLGDAREAVQCIRWYSFRWLIERYHYVLKNGCHLEQLQLETRERIECALFYLFHCGLALIVAHLSSSL